jgi:hypothetical protein
VDVFSADDKATELKVFDALHEPQGESGDQPGVFAIVYQHSKTLHASVTKPDERGQRIAMPEKETVLLDAVEDGQIASAKLNGSAQDDTLAKKCALPMV